ncbi:MAG: WG repeat-containing protein, partial [Bacteroidota bacterium]
GHMSDLLREDLVDLLDPEEQREIRAVVVDTLEESSPQADSFASEQHHIHLTSQRWAMQQGSWLTHRQLSEQMQEFLEREEIEDAMIWDLVNQNQGGFFRFELPKNWRQRLFRKGIPLLGWRGWLKYGLMGLIMLIGLFPYYRQRFAPVLEKVTLQEWLNQQQNLVRIDGEYYRLSSASDSALYFSYIGNQFYEKGDIGSAYNEFDLAMSLAPFEPLYAYQRGITLQRLQNAAQDDSLGRQAYADFSRALSLSGGVRGGQAPQFRSVFSIKEEQTNYVTPTANGSGLMVAAGNRLIRFQVDRSPSGSSGQARYRTTKQQVWDFEGTIEAIASHPNRDDLVAVAAGGKLNLIAIDAEGIGKGLVLNQAAHTRPVRALAFSPDGSQLISAGDDHLALIWEVINYERLQLRHALEFIHTAEVLDAGFSSDGKLAVTSSADSTVVFWDASDGSFKRVVNFNGPVYQGKLVAGGAMLALNLGQSGRIRLHDLRTGKAVALATGEGNYLSLTTSQDEFVWGSTYKLSDEEVWTFQLRSGSRGSDWAELSLEDFIPLALSRNEGVYSQTGLRSGVQPELVFRGEDWVAASIPNQGVQVFTQEEKLASTTNPYYLGATYGRGVMALGQKRWLEATQKFRSMLSDSSLRPGWRSKAQLGLGTALLYAILQDPSVQPEDRAGLFLMAVEELAAVVSSDTSLIRSLRRLTPILLTSYQRIPFDQQLLDQVCNLVEEYQANACNLFTYDEVKPYRMGLAAVRRDKLWGYLDSLQELVIPLQFVEAGSFNPATGLAKVLPLKLRGVLPAKVSEVLIDQSAEVKYGLQGLAAEGIWPAYDPESNQWGYLDEQTYSPFIPFEYDEVWPFYRGFARVRVGKSYGLIDRKGAAALQGISYSRLEVRQGPPDLLIMQSRQGRR